MYCKITRDTLNSYCVVSEETKSDIGLTVGLAAGIPAVLVCCGIAGVCVLVVSLRHVQKRRKNRTIIQLQDLLREDDD